MSLICSVSELSKIFYRNIWSNEIYIYISHELLSEILRNTRQLNGVTDSVNYKLRSVFVGTSTGNVT
jgi:hypothetical protein